MLFYGLRMSRTSAFIGYVHKAQWDVAVLWYETK